MWVNRIKGSFYTLFFILLNMVYLVIELSFNARILEVSANLSPHMDFGQLEIYGRTVSASGATILAWRLLVPYRESLNLYRLLIKFCIIAMIVFPLVFMGQKKLVDDLVDLSSAETRRSAEIMSLVKYGIANGFVEIDELAIEELALLTAEGKMFITLSGLLAYNSSNIRDILEKKLDKVAGYAIATQQKKESQRLYRNYLYARDKVLQQFEQYRRLVNEYEQKKSSSRSLAIQLYEQAMTKALLQWHEYQQLISQNPAINQVKDSQVTAFAELLIEAQQQINLCSDMSCYNEGVERLELRVAQLLGFFSALGEWCDQPSVYSSMNKLSCIKDFESIRKKIIYAKKLSLAHQTGLTTVYEWRLAFLDSTDFRTSVFTHLNQQGIAIADSWKFSNHEAMINDMAQQLEQRYEQQYQQQVEQKFRIELAPRTELIDFNKIGNMQEYYQHALRDLTHELVPLNLTRQQFENQFLAPGYFAQFNRLLNKLRAGEDWYKNDAPYEESGKNSLRNLLVPVVAISLSLIFGLLNLLNLFLNFVFLIIEEKLWLRWLGFILLSGFILLLPLQRDYQIYSQGAYQELIQQTELNYGYWAKALDWVARTEPMVYPLGYVLRYNLLNGFDFD